MDTYIDINGNKLFVGALITSSQFNGEGEVVAYLDADDGRFGALLRLKSKNGKIYDTRVKLGAVKLVPRIDPKERITTERYGV